MKRYRILKFDFDSRAYLLDLAPDEQCTPEATALYHSNRQAFLQSLAQELGTEDLDRKLADFQALGSIPFSVLAFHNKFQRQIRTAFVAGGYFPALTGAVALGERILNHVIRAVREDFRKSPEYKFVYGKESFDNWDQAISVLESWSVLLPEVAADFRRLKDLRNSSIHFRPETDANDRQLALEAVRLLSTIIGRQFGAFGDLPWFIRGTLGASFLTKAAEEQSFVRHIYVPNSFLVGPAHTLEWQGSGFAVHDSTRYPEAEITDEEFRDQWNEANGGSRLDAAPSN